jgi:bacterioferritin-associated ferredoxin
MEMSKCIPHDTQCAACLPVACRILPYTTLNPLCL